MNRAFFLTLLAVMSVSALAKHYTPDAGLQKQMWEDFKALYGKEYDTMEEEYKRSQIFVDHLKRIDARNEESALVDGAIHGITRYLDLTPEEFKAKLLGYVANSSSAVSEYADIKPLSASAVKDWTGVLTTPVKDQQHCGSCWAFSATEQIESDTMRLLKKTFVLSPQQIVSCDTVDAGCNGGNTETAYKYVEKAGGIVLNKDYPYISGKGNTGKCKKAKTHHKKIQVSSYVQVKGESAMAAYVAKTGPLSVCVDAGSWQTYTSGIMKKCGQQLDHCVQAVGINTKMGYWKVRNSWNTDWGESGFIRLAYGKNTCGIDTEATYTTVKLAGDSM